MSDGNRGKWVFFDVGDTLFDETPPHLLLFHTMVATLNASGRSVAWDAFNAARIDAVRSCTGDLSGTIREAMDAFCDDADVAEALWKQARAVYDAIRAPRPYGVLANGFQPLLERLRDRARLGAVANQHPPCLEGMRLYGLDRQLSIIVLSEIVGLFKPDPAIFRLALDQAGCRPEDVIFVGDRTDQDVAPARALGMRTIRLRTGIHWVHADPRGPGEEADATVDSLDSLEHTLDEMLA